MKAHQTASTDKVATQDQTAAHAQTSNKPASVIDNRATASAQLHRQDLSNQSPQTRQLQKFFASLKPVTQRAVDEELTQSKFATTQRAEEKEEETTQGKFDLAQRMKDDEPVQGKFSEAPVTQRAEASPNNTGLPDQLKSGIESLSGMSMDHVKVHYNSAQPAQLNAHAYAQGSDIHVAPGQEQHLPHEAWHVVQQAQGRVKPTMQMKMGVPVNDDTGLETEADVMGAKAISLPVTNAAHEGFSSNGFTQKATQLKRYTVERNIKLDLGVKQWDEQKEKKHATDEKKDVKWQHAKTRARGQALAALREIYPESSDCPKEANADIRDNTRGPEFALAKQKLDLKYTILETDPKDQTATSTRTAIYRDAPEGSRAGSTQANGVKSLTGNEAYIGAHLVKREWGGADNMWNVVAWQQNAENIWAKGFERAVDMKGVFGEDPGVVSISVQKEDELITPTAHEEIVDSKPLNKTGNEMIAAARNGINRAVESVPISASGTNFESTTILDSATIGFDLARNKASEKFKEAVDAATDVTEERDTYGGKRPLPGNLDEAEMSQDAKRLDERKKAWKGEKDTYEAGGKDAFEFENTVFKE
jgi:hypothetical protein